MNEIIIGGGCFWCLEAAFKEVDGIEKVTSGYAGGQTEDPSYSEVCKGNTGHAEVVKIAFDSEKITLEKILKLFFKLHDPTTKDREGPDIGEQYRSIILYQNDEQKEIIENLIEEKREDYSEDIVTEVQELKQFYRAEEEHQDY